MLLPHKKEDKKILLSRNLIAGNKALLKSIFALFFSPISNISSRRAVKMPRNAILIHDLFQVHLTFQSSSTSFAPLPVCLTSNPNIYTPEICTESDFFSIAIFSFYPSTTMNNTLFHHWTVTELSLFHTSRQQMYAFLLKPTAAFHCFCF